MTKATENAPKAKPAPAPAAAEADVPEGYVKVETTGSFMLLDIHTGAEINPGVTNIVPNSEFVQRRISLKHLVEVK